MADWTDLPTDLLLQVAHYLDAYTDYVRFRAVRRSWGRVLPRQPRHSYYNIPCLMIPYHPHNDNLRGFYNVLNQQVYYLELPQLTNQKYIGSSKGWLVTLDNGLTLQLLNPLTKSQLQLPPISSFPGIIGYDPNNQGEEYTLLRPMDKINTKSRARVHGEYIRKIVLSSLAPSNDFMAVAIYDSSDKLAFTKFGDDKWTAISTSLNNFHDCIYFDGKIYAVNVLGDLGVCSIDGTPTQLVNLPLKRPKLEVTSKLYLVETNGDMLMVERLSKYMALFNRGRRCYGYKTIGFNLFKFDSEGWLKIENLDGCTIFLGLNTSICISSKSCPKLRGNHIYYTFDHEKEPAQVIGSHACYDFGVFDMTDRSRRCLWHDDPSDPFVWPHPIWVVLNSY
ncbi:F-box protein SKIP23-like [Momordica charantia]|uniref:F-box protein SKIP23-like n=1 Tax=Momordica charantia TaxID=3673 RepID=A0A6J1DP54_MOMCH|nr:F-box protein SKIP23-like [Momordica charantia]